MAQEPNRNRKPEPPEPFFQEPKEEPEPPEPFFRNRNRDRNGRSLLNSTETQEKDLCRGTARTENRNHSLSFLSLFFFGEMPGKPPKKQGFFIAAEPLKSLEKKGKTPKKTRNSSHGKKQGIQKKKGKEGEGSNCSNPKP